MICNENNAQPRCFTMHDKTWLDSPNIKMHTKINLKIFGYLMTSKFELKKWVQQHYGKDYKDTLGDSILLLSRYSKHGLMKC